MAVLSTVQVNVHIHYPGGLPSEGAHVIAELQSPSQNDDGYIVPKPIKEIIDANGDASLELWPNENGDEETFYKITAHDTILGELLNVVTVVPESNIPLDLKDIALPITTLSLGQASGNVASIRRVDTDEGLTGGGDLTTNRTHHLDLSTLSTEEPLPPLDWIVAVQDPNAPDEVRYASLGSLPGVGFDIEETSVATVGQTEIFIEEVFGEESGQLDLFIDGVYQCRDTYAEAVIVDPQFSGKIILTEALEGGEDICVIIKRNASFGFSVDASQVTYSGGGSVEDALDTLFSTTGSNPFQTIDSNYTASAGDRLFIDTTNGSLDVTLPASPNVGDSVVLIDVTSNTAITGGLLDNPFNILRNGSLIMEIADDFEVDQARVSIEMIYAGASFGWRLTE